MEYVKEVKEAIQGAEKIVITAHRSPDGDAMGSSVAMYHYIKALGKKPVICHPDPSPDFLDWITKGVEIYNFEDHEQTVKELMANAELIFCLDYNAEDRLGHGMSPLLTTSKAKKVMIDHHPNPDNFTDYPISETHLCSTCQIVYELISQGGDLDRINVKCGEAIYLGIMTDTGSFRYPSVDARTHEIVANLIQLGVDHTSVHERTFDDVGVDRLRLRGYAISEKLEIITQYGVAFISLTGDELERFHYRKGDTEGLVNIALSVSGIKVAAFFSQKDGEIKISFRSKGTIAVNMLASEHFDGGGHKNAAGGMSHMSMDETIAKFKQLIPRYFNDTNA